MPSVPIRNLEFIRRENPKLYEALIDIQGALQPSSQSPPPPVTSVSAVSLGNGAVDVTFADSGPVNQGVNYFVEHADNPNFLKARVEHLGASRGAQINVGSGARYWRVYSQYQNPPSQPNAPVVFGGGAPTAVGGGGTATPALQQSTGSGTAATNGQQVNWGFGRVKVRQ